jgi:hypothetical protein
MAGLTGDQAKGFMDVAEKSQEEEGAPLQCHRWHSEPCEYVDQIG